MPGNSYQKTRIKLSLLPLTFIILLLPSFFFFENRGGLSVFEGVGDARDLGRLLFPLFGLYAFTFLWFQFMMGSSALPLRGVFSNITIVHRRFGILTFLFAFIHPLLILLAYGLNQFIGYKFLPSYLRIYAAIGTTTLLLMMLTVATARLAKVSFLQKRWRIIHYANYLVFTLAWIHSWFIGSDIQISNLKYLWIFFGATAAGSAVWRVLRALSRSSVSAGRLQVRKNG